MSDSDGNTIPKTALWLSVLAMIPFIAPPLAMLTGAAESDLAALTLQFGYAAVILSLLGGVHLGRALAGDHIAPTGPRLFWAMTPAVIGWVLMLVPDPSIIALGFAAAFVIAFTVDIKAVKYGVFPRWYGRMRKYMTIGALISLGLTLSAGFRAVPL